MKPQSFDLSLFIDPISGRMLSTHQLPKLPRGYILVGDAKCQAVPSSALLDARVDISTLFNTAFALAEEHPLFPNAFRYGTIRGTKGEQGATGVAGAQGEKGDQGAKGEKGDKGERGKDGVTRTRVIYVP